MKKSPPANTVEEYLAAVESAEVRRALEALRGQIRAVVPKGAVEAISYGMPTFKVKGKAVAHYAAFKEHCSFFPGSGAIVEKFEEELKHKGFKTSKGTIQFTPEQPIPKVLLAKIIRARMAETGAGH
jgi:uncharacterized protein YdhG (YjbR/CyaY superfamily)